MPLTTEQILEQLRELSPAERLRVAEQIIREAADQVSPDAAATLTPIWSDESDDDFHAFQTALKRLRTVDAEVQWRDEIRRRVDAIEAGTAELEDWESVRGRLRTTIEK